MARFVKDVVIRQKCFCADRQDAAIDQNGRAVGQPFCAAAGIDIDKPHHDGRPSRRLGRQLPQRLLVFFDETGLFDKVARRVSGDAQLGKNDQLGPAPLGPGDEGPDFAQISRDVTDRRVDLGKGDFHYSGII